MDFFQLLQNKNIYHNKFVIVVGQTRGIWKMDVSIQSGNMDVTIQNGFNEGLLLKKLA